MSPQEVSLTTFMDFMLKSGTPRVTYVNDAIACYDDDYEPAFDYWKQFRDAVAAMHCLGRDKSTLDEVLQRVGEHKRDNYAKAGRECKRFLGRKRVAWSEPPRAVWSAGGLRVRVNPELGLNIDGERSALCDGFGPGMVPSRVLQRGETEMVWGYSWGRTGSSGSVQGARARQGCRVVCR